MMMKIFLATSSLVVLGWAPISVAPTPDVAISSATKECVDLELTVQCREWEWHGECQRNPEFMFDKCRKTCGVCTSTEEDEELCQNSFKSCKEWAGEGKCHGLWTSKKGAFNINAAWLIEFCPYSCKVCDIHLDERDLELGLGLPQEVPGMETDRQLRNHLRAKVAETREYVESLDNPELQAACKMSHPNCARFALATDCADHADHEIIKFGCASACQTCEDLLYNDGIEKATKFWETALKDYQEKRSRWTVGKEEEVTATA